MKSLSLSLLLLLGSSCVALAGEVIVPVSSQVDVNVTIYNEGRALIKDEREVSLSMGENTLAFQGVSANMMPQTALLKGNGLFTKEQNFNYDLLTKEALLKKSVGHQVTTEYIDPVTGKAQRGIATLLAYNDKPVLKIGNKIETDYPGRIVFDSVPADLRAEPTLSVVVESDKQTQETVELDYLTQGLSWKADYVAKLNEDETKMALNAFVTLQNHSGAAYKNALLQLVAGDVNVAREPEPKVRFYTRTEAMDYAVAPANMTAESLSDFYIYTVPHKTDLLSNQTKQVALFSVDDVGVTKTYEFNRPFTVSATEKKEMKPAVYVSFENTTPNHLGKPLPKGIVRFYKEDAGRNMQFVGEDTVPHKAENEVVRLRLGEAFNVSADMKRTQVHSVSDTLKNAAYEVVFKNGGAKDVTVQLMLDFPDNFKLLSETVKSEKVTSNTLKWLVVVPAKGQAVLEYKVQY